MRHNDHEAARCYGKASRLGSETARVRLARLPPEPEPAEEPGIALVRGPKPLPERLTSH